MTSLERRVTSDVLSDLAQLAGAALNAAGDGAKNVAAVLAPAAYEDMLRRIAKEHAGVIGQDRLETVIGKLKEAGLLVAPQVSIAQGYLPFRTTCSMLNGTRSNAPLWKGLALAQELLLKHFS